MSIELEEHSGLWPVRNDIGADGAPYLSDAFVWEADLKAQRVKISVFSGDTSKDLPLAECIQYLHAKDAARAKSFIAAGKAKEQRTIDMAVRIRNRDGYRRYRVRGSVLPDATAVGMAYDVECSEAYLKRLNYVETHDELTGLYNARTIDKYYGGALSKGMLPQSLIVASIDALKEFNETMGYHAGNTLIKNVADVMKECFFDADMIARVGGGDFCAAFFGKERDEIAHRIEEANMQLHKTYLNLVKANVTFGYASCEEKTDFSAIYSRALAHMKRNSCIKKVLSEPCVVDPINEIIAQRAGWGRRVARLSSLATQVGAALHCGEDMMNEIRVLSRIVDIGLIGIDERLLKNRARLSGRDRQEYMRHVDIGRGIIASIETLAFMEPLYLQTFEKYGEQPEGALPACVLAAVTAFDDVAFERGEMEGIRDWLSRQKTRFCPEVVNAMLAVTAGPM